jgi:glycosyltransferase involved in cell wall biosynthesis
LDVFRPLQYGAVQPGFVTFFHSAGMNPHRKGTDQLVRAFARVQGPAKLILHSQVPLEPYLQELLPLYQSLLDKGVLECLIETVGAPGLFHRGDVYVYPNRLDTLGLTVPEALACGLPVVIPLNAPMNEFIDETCGRTVQIARRYARTDGHYWPMVLVSEEDLTRQMQFYVDQIGCIEQLKRAAREYAEKHLDWEQNSKIIPGAFEDSRKLATEEKAVWLSKTQAMERERAHRTVRTWLTYHHPAVAKAGLSLYRTLRGRRD